MITHTRWLAMAIAVASCTCESGPAPVPTPRAKAPPVEQAALPQHMHVHLDAAIELQQAITHGRLVEARELASWIATHRDDGLDNWQPYSDELRIAAGRVAESTDVATAGAHLSRLGRTCGSCHVAQRADVTFAFEPVPPDDATIEAQMRRHQWAAARLWEGVIAPSETSWNDGARVMAGARIELKTTTNGKPNANVVELAEHLRVMAGRAADLRDLDARADLYGAMMATCAGCHSVVRPTPVSRR